MVTPAQLLMACSTSLEEAALTDQILMTHMHSGYMVCSKHGAEETFLSPLYSAGLVTLSLFLISFTPLLVHDCV